MEADDFIDVVTQDSNLSEQLSEGTSDHISQKDIYMNEITDVSNFQPPKIDFDSIGEFCFESDELALRGNTDYKNLLEAIVVLEAQKMKAVKDLEKLETLKEEALGDPFAFVERMRKKDLQFPTPQIIHPVPTIDWGKYAVNGNPAAFERRQIAQQKRQIQEFNKNNKKTKQQVVNYEPTIATANPIWSSEDLLQLKELLVKLPPEEEETLRWEKISSYLGNHTPFEVASKVYAQFATLATQIGDNLGKLPDLCSLKKKWSISNEEGSLNFATKGKEAVLEISDEEDISSDLQDSPEYQELLLLKKALREKIVEESSSATQHVGYKCCRCKTVPIVGNRWHCVDCKPPLSLDFCEDCSECPYETRHHNADHQLEKQAANKGFLDRDYMHFMGSDYNYLDPNYMPAT
ncbi:hypothetical protein JTE90_006948 [Oedothorax gibbosus]|uniref:ZZ-type domain-containing protein n=1 Tax=Oedothorax gibbosus TaxID=931172 RepID=A0AAV6TZM2_9ARAC|nr:hypothetical protein JTE90_006948 [Oedothorax gibbosus]